MQLSKIFQHLIGMQVHCIEFLLLNHFLNMHYPGSLSFSNIPTTFKGIQTLTVAWLTVFIVTIFAMLRTIPSRMARRLSNQSGNHDHHYVDCPQEPEHKEEFRPPSPVPSYTEKDVLSAMLRRLVELEEKVQVLETKPSVMPFDKEELLNASARRVDALEADLISTKKVYRLLKLW